MKIDSPIAVAMRKKGLTQDQVAKSLGVSRQAVQKWTAGGDSTVSNLKKLAAVLGVSVAYLTGEAEDDKSSVQRVSDPSIPPPDGYTRVPILSAYGSCGPGEENTDEYVIGFIDFADWFCRTFPGVSSIKRLEIVNSSGDSMEPTIAATSLLVLDRNQSTISRDGIFCFRNNSELFIKRVQRNIDGTVLLLSDNPLYKPIKVDRLQLENSEILGRVVYVFNGKSII